MNRFFEILDRSTGNVIKDYSSEEEALNELREISRTYGLDEIRDIALLRFEEGRPTLIAMEKELIARLREDEGVGQEEVPQLRTTRPTFFEIRSNWVSSVGAIAHIVVELVPGPIKYQRARPFSDNATLTKHMEIHCAH